METLAHFLDSPLGSELIHAIIILTLAVAGYLNYLAQRSARRNGQVMNRHLEQHLSERSTPLPTIDSPELTPYGQVRRPENT